MKYELYVKIAGLPKMLNQTHYANRFVKIKEAKIWKEKAFWMCAPSKPEKPLKKAILHFERHSMARPDDDNLAISFKHVRDGLIMAAIIEDDGPDFVSCTYEWIKAPRGQGFITIRVKSVDEDTTLLSSDTQQETTPI